jgi:acylglycerol lipase
MTASPQFPSLPSNWTEETSVFDGVFYRKWINKNADGKNGMFIVHGQGEQSSRYTHFPFYLNESLSWIVALDLVGHGKTLGQRGHIDRFSQYHDAVLTVISQCHLVAKRTFLFGHSMGGLIVLGLLSKNKVPHFDSVIASAPLLDLALPVPPLKKFFGELVEPLLGSIKLNNEIPAEYVSRDPEVQKQYLSDPLNHNNVSPRFFVQMSKEMSSVRDWDGPIKNSVLMIVPMEDKIVSWKANIQFFKNLKLDQARLKELHTFPGYYHESFNEPGKERPFIALKNWIDRQF